MSLNDFNYYYHHPDWEVVEVNDVEPVFYIKGKKIYDGVGRTIVFKNKETNVVKEAVEYDTFYREYNKHQNKYPLPHQGKKECERRIKQQKMRDSNAI